MTTWSDITTWVPYTISKAGNYRRRRQTTAPSPATPRPGREIVKNAVMNAKRSTYRIQPRVMSGGIHNASRNGQSDEIIDTSPKLYDKMNER